jgi:hypothetical protein
MGEFARCLTTCATPFDWGGLYVPTLCDVLIIEQEIGPRGLKERMAKVMANEPRKIWQDRLYYESKRPELMLDTPEGRKYIGDMIKDIKPNVLILDPISMMHGYDENSTEKIALLFKHLEKFKQINPDKEMSVVISHHFKKPPHDMNGMIPVGFDRLDSYNFRGSSKWKDSPDVIMTMYRGKNIDTQGGWESWETHVRWITRHGSPPPEMVMSVHGKADDGRVRFIRTKEQKKFPKIVEGPHKPIKIPPAKVVDMKQVKLGFNPV